MYFVRGAGTCQNLFHQLGMMDRASANQMRDPTALIEKQGILNLHLGCFSHMFQCLVVRMREQTRHGKHERHTGTR